MLGSVFVVCKSLDQLGDCQQDRTNLRAPSEQTEHSSSDQEPTTGNNQPSPPPAVLNQCWIESGIVVGVFKNIIQMYKINC